MKKVLWLVLILIIAGGICFLWVKPKQKPAVIPIQISGTEAEKEETIKNKVAESNIGLKHMRVAVWSYVVDNNTIPENISMLTTPVAYLARIPVDPFTEGGELNFRKLGKKQFIIWGIGPDGKNDDGQIVYNQNNGLTSSGDIVRAPTSN